MNKLGMGLLAAFVPCIALAVGPALAADLPVRPVYKAPPPVPVVSWTGFYVGGNLGARWNTIDSDVTSATLGGAAVNQTILSPSGSSFDSTALRAGVFAGWNWQTGPWVVGVEGDIGWANKTKTRDGTYPAELLIGTPTFPGPYSVDGGAFSVKTTWDASARARVGWLFTPNVLVFATGGAAWMRLETSSDCQSAPPTNGATCATGNFFNGTLSPVNINNSQTRLGWTIGGGIETMLGSGWFARAEYRYSDYGTADFTAVRTCSGGCIQSQANPLSVSYSTRVTTQAATVGIAYKFGY
jgi:outer membrane immunogenic protein